MAAHRSVVHGTVPQPPWPEPGPPPPPPEPGAAAVAGAWLTDAATGAWAPSAGARAAAVAGIMFSYQGCFRLVIGPQLVVSQADMQQPPPARRSFATMPLRLASGVWAMSPVTGSNVAVDGTEPSDGSEMTTSCGRASLPMRLATWSRISASVAASPSTRSHSFPAGSSPLSHH
jgi:hypothetical protein